MTTTITEPTYLSDILNVELLDMDIKNGLVNVTYHPTLPIRIYNYTAQAQYQNAWTEEVVASRGLIVGPDNEIIARGPKKFFNYGQVGAPEISMDDTVWVTRKEDGSLGIGWEYEGHYGVATRGSFTSDQALRATDMLTPEDKQKISFYSQRHNQSMIWEIVYPENRIVLDYGDLSKLIKLGYVGNESGLINSRNLGIFYGKENFGFEYQMTFAEALALPIPDDEEGYVLDIFEKTDTGMRTTGHIKLKGDNYKRLHAIVTNTSERVIWTYLVGEKFKDYIDPEKPKLWGSLFMYDHEELIQASQQAEWRATLFDTVPDEFEMWVEDTIDRLETDAYNLYFDALVLGNEAISKKLEGKALFDFMKDHPFQLELIRYVRGGNPMTLKVRAWREVQPRGVTRPFATNEDTN